MDNDMASNDEELGGTTTAHDSDMLNGTHGGADAATGNTANELDTDTDDLADTAADDGYVDDDDDEADTAIGGVTGGAGTI